LTLGLKQAGFRVVGAVDIDELCVETYKANHPEVRVWPEDVCKLSSHDIKRELGIKEGVLDLLAGCPPCQGFSSMRTLNGARPSNDPRNELVFQFLRFVRELQPRSIMMENVPGLARDKRMRILCDEFKRLGYTLNLNVLDAADYGVPQRRRRMMLLGSRCGRIEFAPKDPRRITVREAIGLLPKPGESRDPLHDLPENRSPAVVRFIQGIPKDGGSRSALGGENQLGCHKRCDGFKDVYGRMAWDSVSPTITSGCFNPSKGRFLHPEEDRAITLREAAMLQAFPADYYFSLRRGKYAAAALIGNALPPELVRRHALAVSLMRLKGGAE
jgi:DNA (cytosine-5)-methyltransferase 1